MINDIFMTYYVVFGFFCFFINQYYQTPDKMPYKVTLFVGFVGAVTLFVLIPSHIIYNIWS
jgi:hypothetical protein